MKMKLLTLALPLLTASIVAASTAHARDGGEAEINLQSLNTTGTVDFESGTGCLSGQNWDVVVGGCVTEQSLSTSSSTDTEYRFPSCPAGQTGSILETRSVTTTTTQWGWRVPPNGQVKTSRTST